MAKKMSKTKAAKTIIKETVSIAKKKAKINELKRTNRALRKMREGKALTAKDSARLAAAKAKKKGKK